MGFSRLRNFFVALMMALILMSGAYFILQGNPHVPAKTVARDTSDAISNDSAVSEIVYVPPEKLSTPPEIVKSVYMTSYSATSKKYLNYLENFFNNTEINAAVVDVKGGAIKDVDSLVRFFHEKNIYAIARIVVFQDSQYAKLRPDLAIYNKEGEGLWKDNKGLTWMDPASKEVWNYNVSLAKNAFYHGFDEVNFDYIRFPSDGDTKNMDYPVFDEKNSKRSVIREFFQYLRTELAGEKISVDLFGQTTVNKDDMGVGQMLEDAFEFFDYVCPMIYPSHYADGFIGFQNPAEHPYEVVKYSLNNALARERILLGRPEAPLAKAAQIRPWLQDFNMGADYTAELVKQEITATQDSLENNFKGFMLWNPSNIYTQEAVLRPN